MLRPSTLAFTTLALALGCITGTPVQAAPADFECIIKPQKVVEIHAPAVGLIERVLVDVGDVVKAGQVLATLESKTEQAAADLARFRAGMTGPLQTAQAKVDHTLQRFSRKDELQRKGFVTTDDKDQAQVDKRLAEAELHEARENQQLAQFERRRTQAQLDLRTIRSPLAGVVTERLLHPGEVAELGVGQKPMLKIAELDPLRVEVILPLAMYGTLAAGGAAEVTPEAPLRGVHLTRIKGVDRVVDAGSGTFTARLELPNPDHKLPAGVRCRARFTTSLPNAAAARAPAVLAPAGRLSLRLDP